MASGPTWNPQRNRWYVQYHDGVKLRRVTVAKGPPRWRDGDPIPKVPPEAKAAFKRWQDKEDAAKQARAKGQPTDLAAFLDDHVASYPKEGTRRIVRIAADQFLAWCRAEGITQFEEIDKSACNRFLRAAAVAPPDGKAPSLNTMKTRRAFLAAAWGRLMDEEKIDKNPWKGTELRSPDRAKPRNAWTLDQYRKLLDHAEPWLRDVLVVGVHTGLRIDALMKLEWRDWHHPEPGEKHLGFIVVRKEVSKSGESYKVPVSEELHDLLSRRMVDRDAHRTFILTAKRGGTLKYSTQTAKAIVKACAAADLARPQSPNHHLRRTFGRLAVRGQLTGEPVSLYVVSRWLGHKNPKTTLVYLGLEDEESARFMVPKLFTPAADGTPPSAMTPS